MRSLAQPEVVRSASIAAVVTALVCYPRFSHWQTRILPIWYLELSILLASFFLWSFVFGWQGKYGGRDPLEPSRSPSLWLAGTALALVATGLNRWLLDPAMRTFAPEDFPTDLESWFAMTLFSLSLTQLFLGFAPLALFLRLLSRRGPAIALTLAFGLFVMWLKISSAQTTPPPALVAELVAVRILGGIVLLHFYLQGGLPLAWWIGLVVQARHLPALLG